MEYNRWYNQRGTGFSEAIPVSNTFVDDAVVMAPPSSSLTAPVAPSRNNTNVIQTPSGPVSPVSANPNNVAVAVPNDNVAIANPAGPAVPTTPVLPNIPVTPTTPVAIDPVREPDTPVANPVTPVAGTVDNPVVVAPGIPVVTDTPAVITPIVDDTVVVAPEDSVKTAGLFSDNKLLMGVLIGAAVYALLKK